MNIMNTIYHNLIRGIITSTIFFLILYPATNAYSSPYSLEVSKSSQELLIKDGEDIIKRYRVAFGKGGSGSKRQLGDNKTPTGTYKILEFRENSRFHLFMQISYPNTIDAWYGYKNNLIDGKEFKDIVKAATSNVLPPQNTSLGGYLGLHGIGEVNEEKLSIHDRHNWTEGCIALKNEEITEIRQYVSIGTTILIKE
jgi:murein L,D-transpeptidase YafK